MARGALDELSFAAAWEAGRALTQSQAEAEALAVSLGPAQPPLSLLSPREAQILPFLAAGRTHREIGVALFISECTVDSHVIRLFRKLEVRTRAEAIATARRAGLLDVSDPPGAPQNA